MPTSRTPRAAAVIVALSLAGACSDDDSTSGAPASQVASATTPATTTPATTSPASSSTGPPTTEAAAPTGPACDRFPPAGEGSLAALARQPMGTAMASVPRLSALVAAIDAAGLLEALDGPGPLTLLAPVNAAFEAIPAARLDALLTDAAALNSVLLYHAVAGGSLSQAELAQVGEATSIEGQPLTFTEHGPRLSINDGQAAVICANVATANGTIHLVNAILMPG